MRANDAVRSCLVAAATLAVIALSLPAGVASAQPKEPSIHILNPSSQGATISAAPTDSEEEPDSGDERYRLNAWVNNPPQDAIVEFELEGSSENIAIGTAKQTGADAFEYLWDVADVSAGGYTLRALLYNGSEQVAIAERDVEVADGSIVPALAAAADITYPANAGKAGFYTNAKEEITSVVLDVAYSAGTSSVAAFYTTSDVGSDPEWKRCATDGVSTLPTGASGETIVECALDEEDTQEAVTGVAAVANLGPTPVPNTEILNRGGDAVRVFPYLQDANRVLADPATHSIEGNEGEPPFACSEEITIAVLDQNGRAIPNFPVDAHASGPTDALRFAGTFGPNGTAPDEGHDHEEEARDCAPGGLLGGSQGDHNRPGGSDSKHLESTTGTAGTWSVQLWSNESGATALTLWADEDDNDRYCASEPAIGAVVGWGGRPSGVGPESPEEASCNPPPPPEREPDPKRPSCTIRGTAGDDVLTGTSGDDTICGFGGDDRLFGRGGGDVIKGGPGRDSLRGSRGRDDLRGGPGRDALRGGSGADSMNGGPGKDDCRGGRGPDQSIRC